MVARINLSLDEQLKDQMRAFDGLVNWSQIATTAFEQVVYNTLITETGVMDRNEIALACLVAMIKSLPGEKDNKVRAAFDYADMFMREALLREQTRDTDELHLVANVAKLREILSIQGVEIDEIDVIIQDLRGQL